MSKPPPAAHPAADCDVGRRTLLTALGAAGAAALLRSGRSIAVEAKPTLIDVHRHITAPLLRATMEAQGRLVTIFNSDSTQRMLDDMNIAGVTRSILTLQAPPAQLVTTAADRVAIARDANETLARRRADYPERFGFFAALPLPDIDNCLAEIPYVLDVLKADGVMFLTSYGNKWLGEAEFGPLFQELNRRKAVIYTHPLEAACCSANVPELPSTLIEYAADTVRAIARFIFSGAARKYPDMKLIFSHAGGALTSVMQRLVLQVTTPRMQERVPQGVEYELRRFYYDTAQSYHPSTLRGLRVTVPASQVLFGTDYPYRSAFETWAGVRDSRAFTAVELRQIASGNARLLLGR